MFSLTEGGDIDKLEQGCVWSGEISPCIHQNHVFAVRCTDALPATYLLYLLDTAVARNSSSCPPRRQQLASPTHNAGGVYVLRLPASR